MYRRKLNIYNFKRSLIVILLLIFIIIVYLSLNIKSRVNIEDEVKNSNNDNIGKAKSTLKKGLMMKPIGKKFDWEPLPIVDAGIDKRINKLNISKEKRFEELRKGHNSIKNEKKLNVLYDFLNESLDNDKRAQDLVSRLSLDQIIQQCNFNYHSSTPHIDSLGIKSFAWHTDCLHGSTNTKSTAFPHSIGLAATFDSDLLKLIASSIADELRSINSIVINKEGEEKPYHGLNCFAPIANIMLHPTWGRNQETYGEDPYLVSKMVRAFIEGMQGDDKQVIKIAAGCKHFIANSGPESESFNTNHSVSDRDMHLTFLPPFEECVKAGASSIKCSNHKVNGVPTCIHKYLKTILRDKLKFNGVIVSDDRAITNLLQHHKSHITIDAAAFEIFKAGVNLEGGGMAMYYLKNSIKKGKVTEAEIRQNALPVFKLRIKLGEFNKKHRYKNTTPLEIQHKQHKDLAQEAIQKSIVLLKNLKFLPISNDHMKKFKRLTLLGPFINTFEIFGSVAPKPDERFATNVHDGLKWLANETYADPICLDSKCAFYEKEKLLKAFKYKHDNNSIIILTLGTGPQNEGELKDRENLELPGKQAEFLDDVIELGEKTGIPIILLLFGGGPLNITRAHYAKSIKAILVCFYPGQETGVSLFRILTNFGKNSIPSGRLPFTWHTNSSNIDSITNYNMSKSYSYRYFHGNSFPLYPFGYGLSYTTFHYYNISTNVKNIKIGQPIDIKVTLKNTGILSADEIVQLYIEWLQNKYPMPKLQLISFKRLYIKVGTVVVYSFQLRPKSMAIYTTNKFEILPGQIRIYAGGCLPNQKIVSSSGKIVQTVFTLTGESKQII